LERKNFEIRKKPDKKGQCLGIEVGFATRTVEEKLNFKY
jgi:hypothetical protein